MTKKGEKIPVVIGEPLLEDIRSADGSIMLARKGVIVTKALLNRLSNWIFEKEPMPQDDLKPMIMTDEREAILKRLEFQEIVSNKTRLELEDEMSGFFGTVAKGKAADVSEIEDSIERLVEETPDSPDVPLRMFHLKQHSDFMYAHSLECSILASFVATALNYPKRDVSAFALAMMMHDAGTLSIPGDILNKTQPLTPEDWELIHAHPRNGWNLLKQLPGIDPLVLLVAIGHHTRADGKGYPEEVDHNSLPPLAHLAALIDHFESLTSPRPFRPAYSMHSAVKILLNNRDRYHAGVFESFISAVGVYPVSTFVKLDTGDTGVVVRNNPDNLFLPEIKLTLDPDGNAYSKEITMDLLNTTGAKIIDVEETV